MAKSKDRSIPVQKGPISMDAQYSYKFGRQPEKTIRDLEDNFMRRSGMTLTKHEPKR